MTLFLLACSTQFACDPMKPSDRAFFKKLDEERSAREARMRGARARIEGQNLIDRVKQHPAAEGQGTMEDSLQKQLSTYQGQVMFPKWSSVRRGSNKEDVLFSFVYIDENNNTRKLQYTWTVDILEMKVDAPVLFQQDQQFSPDRAREGQQERRVRDHEKALE